MSGAASWTSADAAELDVLAWALCEAAETHRENGCAACAEARADGYPVCRRLSAATEELLSWRRRRQLLSRAEWCRRERARLYLAELREGRAA